MRQEIERILYDSIEVKKTIPLDLVQIACERIIHSYRNNGKLLICGNGGSAADAQHMSGEFLNRFLMERDPLPAIALSTDTSTITAIGNDYGFDQIFSKQVQAHGRANDILIGITTSGNSQNIINAAEVARQKGMYVIGFLGKDGGKLKDYCDLPIIIPSNSTPRIQECHELVMHTICEIVERELYKK